MLLLEEGEPVGSSLEYSEEAQTENAVDVTDITGLLEAFQVSTTTAVATPPAAAVFDAANIIPITTTTTTTATATTTTTTTPAAITSPEFGDVRMEETAGSGTEVRDALPGMELDEGSLTLAQEQPDDAMMDLAEEEEVFVVVDDRMDLEEEVDADDEGEDDTAMVISSTAAEEYEGRPAATTDWGFGSMSLSGTPFAFGGLLGQDDVVMVAPQEQQYVENVEMIDQGVVGVDSVVGPSVESAYPSLPSFTLEEGDMDWFGEADELMDGPAPEWSIIHEIESGMFDFGTQQQHFQPQQQTLESSPSQRDVEGSFQPQFNFEPQQQLSYPQVGDFDFQLGQQMQQFTFGQDTQQSSEVAPASEDNDCNMSQAELDELERELLEALTMDDQAWSAENPLIDPQLLALPPNPMAAAGEGSSVVAPFEDATAPGAAVPPGGEEVVNTQGEEEGGVSAPSASATTTTPVVALPEQEISFSFESRSNVFESAPAEDDFVDSYVPVPVTPVLRPEVTRRRRELRSHGMTPVEVDTDDRQDVVSPEESDSSSLDEEAVRQRVAARPMLRPRLRASNSVRQAVAEQVQEIGESSSAPRKKTIAEMRAEFERMSRTGSSDFEAPAAPRQLTDEEVRDHQIAQSMRDAVVEAEQTNVSFRFPIAPSTAAAPTTFTAANFDPVPSFAFAAGDFVFGGGVGPSRTSEEPEPVAEGSSSSAEAKEGQHAEEQTQKSSEVEAHQGEEAELEAAVEERLRHETTVSDRRKRRYVDSDGDVADNADANAPGPSGSRRILPCRGLMKRVKRPDLSEEKPPDKGKGKEKENDDEMT
ncbi:hypothetical protein B0T21DRAFT_385390 [Apiosordaria backusii]|uniref:Uncharacterized protein n=1 Tax=Apiosordaria backusii TaxID=314023 RepID=A0AA40B7Y4_9PEZI|nr:hypothetical protein B0T21DRAFT_385390 [Apiosordaria backusii]